MLAVAALASAGKQNILEALTLHQAAVLGLFQLLDLATSSQDRLVPDSKMTE